MNLDIYFLFYNDLNFNSPEIDSFHLPPHFSQQINSNRRKIIHSRKGLSPLECHIIFRFFLYDLVFFLY